MCKGGDNIPMTTNNFSEAVLVVMDKLKLKKTDIAKLTGYSNQHVGHLLNGERRWNEESIKKFCDALDIEVTYGLKDGEENEPRRND